MRYKFEFEAPSGFEPGDCENCPISYEEFIEDEWGDSCYHIQCPICDYYSDPCPLKEVVSLISDEVIVIDKIPQIEHGKPGHISYMLERMKKAHIRRK